MASTKTNINQPAAATAALPELADRREDGDRLAALYGLTPKVETAIAAAIADGDPDWAAAVMRTHIYAAREVFRRRADDAR